MSKKLSIIKLKSQQGFTLAELMVAALILVTILVGLLASYVTCFDLNETSKNTTLAVDAAQQKMAQVSDYSFANACSNFNNTNFTLADSDLALMPAGESRGKIYVYAYTGSSTSNSCADCTCDYDMLRVVVSVCWRQKSGRVIGEDKDLDGILDAGEDTNGNGKIDSPVQLVAFLTAG